MSTQVLPLLSTAALTQLCTDPSAPCTLTPLLSSLTDKKSNSLVMVVTMSSHCHSVIFSYIMQSALHIRRFHTHGLKNLQSG